MGKIIRKLEFDSKEDMKRFLEDEFDYCIDLKKDNLEYKNQELSNILVNLHLEYKDDKTYLTITKLVTLKALLLSKEQDMDIMDLVFKIDKIMKMSKYGLGKIQSGILDDSNLEEFLSITNIKVEESKGDSIILYDNKRSVSVDYKDNGYWFNTIKLIEEF